MATVTDPSLIAQLDAHAAATNGTPVTDPGLISQLDALSPTTTALGAAGRGALDAVPFGDKAAAGVQAALDPTPKSYKDYLSELDMLVGADKEQHPIAHDVGEVAGTAAPLAIPGVGEALSAESIAGRASIGAGLGALQGASSNRDTANLPSDVLKDAAIGGVAGPAVGKLADVLAGAGRGVGKGLSDALHDNPSPSIPDKVSAFTPPPTAATGPGTSIPMGPSSDLPTFNVTDRPAPATVAPTGPAPTPAAANPFPEKQGLFPSQNELKAEVLAGVLGGSPRQLRNLPGKDIIATLDHMSDVIAANSTKENPLISMNDRYADRQNKFTDWANSAGKTIGSELDKANVAPVPTAPIIQAVQNSQKFPSLDDANRIKGVVDAINQYSAQSGTPGAISFDGLHALKGDIGGQAFNGQGNPALQSAYHIISDLQDDLMQHAGPQVNMPAFNAAKEAYMTASRALPMLKMATARSLSKGYSSYGKPLGSLISGHPLDAVGDLLKEPIERALQSTAFRATHGPLGNTSAGLGNAATKAATYAAPNLAHPAMAQFKPQFQAALQGVTDPAMREKTIATTDYVLQQNNPAYAQAKQAAAESERK